jgi:hypothetical protein
VLVWVLAILIGAPFGSVAGLWPEEQQRLRVGLKLFPAVLGAQEELRARCGPDGMLRVLVVHRGSDEVAQRAARSLKDLGEVDKLPLAVGIRSLGELESSSEESIAAIFVASVGLEHKRLRRLSERHRVLVFSPFAGDVAGGAVAGIHVADRILPAVNLEQAKRAGLRFKAFFLRVAHHGE